MDHSVFLQFVSRLNIDDELRRKVVEAERLTSNETKRDADVITQIAAEAGYDITGWSNRPDAAQPVPGDQDLARCCTLTCCLVATSAMAAKVRESL